MISEHWSREGNMVRSLSDMIATSVEGFKLRPRWEELPSLLSRGIQCQVLVFKMTFPRSESLLIPSGGHRKETHSITWDRVVGPTHTHIHTHTPTHFDYSRYIRSIRIRRWNPPGIEAIARGWSASVRISLLYGCWRGGLLDRG